MAKIAIYPLAKYANALSRAREALDESGFFDSVTLDSGTVTCEKDGESIATVRLGGAGGSWFTVTFNGITIANETNIGSFIIASTNKAVFISFLSSSSVAYGVTFSTVFTKSKNGKLMCGYSQGYARTLAMYAEDTTNTQSTRTTVPVSTNTYYSSLVPVCVATGSEDLVSTTADFFRFYDRLSSIPRGSFSSFMIDDKKYLTDGEVCVTDNE